MGRLLFILGDQLTHDVAGLTDLNAGTDIVLMVEVAEETTYVRHHKQKITLILSAMRHFAGELRAKGINVDYVTLDDPENTGSFTGELMRAVLRHQPHVVVVTEASEWRVLEMMKHWRETLECVVEIREDNRFFASHDRFSRWADGRKSLRMEFFYREMRRETGLLVQDDQPVGGQWNFDHDNRKSLPKGMASPDRLRFKPDRITREVMALVATRFNDHFGDLDTFEWPVTRTEALAALDHFITQCLPKFGDYQDAMKAGNPFLFHALISPCLNIGLLTPREVCARAQAAWNSGQAPLNAVEGFIRQVLGWREYIRGIYWHHMPGYAETNALGAKRPLPWFYWSGETSLNCIAEVVKDTRQHAYAHHIQRLMVTGNFALLAGIHPKAIEDWYLAVYADAFDWVELPNVHGMVMFADGGLLASKPYAASGAYIDRMSDYCAGCDYDPKIKIGPKACPFNLLYWNFMIENREVLGRNPRMAMPYRTLDAMALGRKEQLQREAQIFLDTLSATGSDDFKPASARTELL
ncbi:MAG: cryptochrome/photolyase family protein [Beijerinckiaceae bacterium]